MNQQTPDKHPIDMQAAFAVTALAVALCKQPGIDGQKLRIDFLDAMEGLAATPEGVDTVGRQTAALMSIFLDARAAGID